MIRKIEQPKLPAGRRWMYIVIGLLAAHVTGMMCAVWAISGRPGESAVLPDYYSKALQWDQYRAQLRASDALGWNVQIQQLDENLPDGRRQVRMVLTGADQKPVNGAALIVHCYHLSHGDEAKTIQPPDTGGSQFLLTLPQPYQGFWQFELTATAGGKTYIHSATQYIY